LPFVPAKNAPILVIEAMWLQTARAWRARILDHGRFFVELQVSSLLAESHVKRRLFGGILRRIATLPAPAG